MPEGVEFPFPSLLFHEGRTYGQPEVVLISLPQVATGLRSRLPGSFRRRGFQPDLLMPQAAVPFLSFFSYRSFCHNRMSPFDIRPVSYTHLLVAEAVPVNIQVPESVS